MVTTEPGTSSSTGPRMETWLWMARFLESAHAQHTTWSWLLAKRSRRNEELQEVYQVRPGNQGTRRCQEGLLPGGYHSLEPVPGREAPDGHDQWMLHSQEVRATREWGPGKPGSFFYFWPVASGRGLRARSQPKTLPGFLTRASGRDLRLSFPVKTLPGFPSRASG
jgi:hypothetical protein